MILSFILFKIHRGKESLQSSGIYETNLSEYFDSNVILADLRMIQRLNDWSDSIAGGLEVFIKDASNIDEVGYAIGETMDFDLNIESANDKYIQVFEWLNLLSRQVNILLGVILIVVSVNIISIILILVMERTQMIGMLKALGGGNKFIRSIFIYNGMSLIAKGLLLGNLIGLGLCYIQYQFKIVKLNPHDYYMSFVPISWQWGIVGDVKHFYIPRRFTRVIITDDDNFANKSNQGNSF